MKKFFAFLFRWDAGEQYRSAFPWRSLVTTYRE